MQIKPAVLALGTGFETEQGQKLYERLKSLAQLHWYHSPLKNESWPSTLQKFVDANGPPLALMIYGARIHRIDQALLDPLLPGLRLVASQGAGYDNVDVEFCTKNKVWVSNTPDSVTDSTANCAVWLVLSCLRNFVNANEEAKIGEFRKNLSFTRDPSGLKLGVVGLGRIGSSVARKLRVFGMDIYYNSRHRASEEVERDSGDAKFVKELKDLVARCDVVTVHVPLSDSTRHLFNEDIFDSFSGGIFINTARGKIHDEKALVAALKSEKVAAAGLDVYEDEPEISEEFLRYGALPDRVITTPHIGAFTRQAQVKWEIEMLENVLGVIKHDEPKHPVNSPDLEFSPEEI